MIVFLDYVSLMIVYLDYVFNDQWPFCLVAMAALNLKTFLNDNSKTTGTLIRYKHCLGKGNSE